MIKYVVFYSLEDLQRRFLQTTDKVINIQFIPGEMETRNEYRVFYYEG